MRSLGNITLTRFVLPLALVGAGLLAGCAGGGYGYGDGRYGRDAAQEAQDYNRAKQASRENLADRVRAVMRSDMRLGAGIVVESPEDGVIVLSGLPAGGMAQAQIAVDRARSVFGVRQVVNRLALN